MLQFKDSSGSMQDTLCKSSQHSDTLRLDMCLTLILIDSYVVITLKTTDPNTDSLLLNKIPITLKWKSIEIRGDIYYYYGTLPFQLEDIL